MPPKWNISSLIKTEVSSPYVLYSSENSKASRIQLQEPTCFIVNSFITVCRSRKFQLFLYKLESWELVTCTIQYWLGLMLRKSFDVGSYSMNVEIICLTWHHLWNRLLFGRGNEDFCTLIPFFCATYYFKKNKRQIFLFKT